MLKIFFTPRVNRLHHYERRYDCWRVCVMLCLSVLLSGCASYGGYRVENGEGMRQKSWADFQKNRPEPKYIHANSPVVTRLCADITDIYILTIRAVDRAAKRAEYCEVACKLEAVRCHFGEKAYLDAFEQLTPEERRSYRKYRKSEVQESRAVDMLWYKANDAAWHMSELMYEIQYVSYEYGWSAGLSAGFEAAIMLMIIDEQIEYTIEALSWLREYQKLLERAQNYQGR